MANAGELTQDQRSLLKSMKDSERIQQLVKSEKLMAIIKEVVEKHDNDEDQEYREKEEMIRRNNPESGFRPPPETFLKNYILAYPEFSELVKILLFDGVIE